MRWLHKHDSHCQTLYSSFHSDDAETTATASLSNFPEAISVIDSQHYPSILLSESAREARNEVPNDSLGHSFRSVPSHALYYLEGIKDACA